jgi:hypothetical protein
LGTVFKKGEKMMRRFQDTGYHGNMNFVDKNGVAVGWGMGGDCCAISEWKYTRSPHADAPPIEEDKDFKPEEYSFNPNYHESVVNLDGSSPVNECGAAVAFELVSDIDSDYKVYLILSNFHNGYYSTGITMVVGDKTVVDMNI